MGLKIHKIFVHHQGAYTCLNRNEDLNIETIKGQRNYEKNALTSPIHIINCCGCTPT